MAISLLVISIVLLLGSAAPDLARLRSFDWFERWLLWLNRVLAPNGFWQSAWGLVAVLGPILLPVALIQYTSAGFLYGIFYFCFGLAVFFYCLGPRDLGEDLTDLAHAHVGERRRHAQRAFGVSAEKALSTSELIEPVLSAALKRQFAPIFWFVSFGPAGALAYRLTQLAADSPEFKTRLPDGLGRGARALETAMAWIPAQLMCLALALASDFDAVVKAWGEHHDRRGQGVFDLDVSFLASTVKACIDFDDVDEIADPGVPLDNAPIQHTQALLSRITLAWIVIIALIVFAVYLA